MCMAAVMKNKKNTRKNKTQKNSSLGSNISWWGGGLYSATYRLSQNNSMFRLCTLCTRQILSIMKTQRKKTTLVDVKTQLFIRQDVLIVKDFVNHILLHSGYLSHICPLSHFTQKRVRERERDIKWYNLLKILSCTPNIPERKKI